MLMQQHKVQLIGTSFLGFFVIQEIYFSSTYARRLPLLPEGSPHNSVANYSGSSPSCSLQTKV
jgi:hypothetical protein